ncbi:MAG: PH domain-containing protein [Aliidiomarina sp.]|uniref:PH domain-containing protein n=1 Tax=Aliidiomarina sp. TaxID=1872439 RepID=UPI0025B9B9A5|nr:PH domain-containing protein [Aliidiomarina sp.]MCH8501886.1 PH domain-containing protein [Aliidiomarina sp.]
MERVYTSKIDTWFVLVLVAIVSVFFIVFVSVLMTGQIRAIMLAIPALIVGAGFPLWLMKSTNYTLNDTNLIVRCGPFKWQVPVNQIQSVTPTSNPLSSPALSLDRLQINYGRWGTIMISPKDKEAFIQDLEARCGKSLTITEESR